MKPTLDYGSIGCGFTIRIGLDALSGRDKVELFRTLMDDLGITDRFHANPDSTAIAQTIITEQWAAHWK